MKIRLGFVSNSSSSSFMCDVCERIESGMNMCIEEAGMYQCQKRHIFCHGHKLEVPMEEVKRIVLESKKCNEEEIEEMDDFDLMDMLLDDKYEVPSEICPICQMKNIEHDVLFKYVLARSGLTKERAEEEIKNYFKSYEAIERFKTKSE